MRHRRVQPIHILWSPDIQPDMLHGVLSAIDRVLLLANIPHKFRLENLGQRRLPGWLNQVNMLPPFLSFDWHIAFAKRKSQIDNHLNSVALLDSLQASPFYKEEPKYELAVVREPLHYSSDSLRLIDGIARHGQGAVITLHDQLKRFSYPGPGENPIERQRREFCFWIAVHMLALHEFCHVLGLFPGTDAKDPTDEELKNAHCQNEKCVMWWREPEYYSEDTQINPLCPTCLQKLKEDAKQI